VDEPVNLQREWDRLLIEKFYRHDTLKMYVVSYIFKKTFNLTDEQFNQLKRVPKLPGQKNVYTSRFICAYLPKIADILWKHKAEETETLANAMCKIKYDVEKLEIDYDKITREKANISYSKKKAKQFILSDIATDRINKRSNRNRTWNITK
jgi:hypothetical protein